MQKIVKIIQQEKIVTDPKNPTNLPEFDLDVYEVASRLKQNPVDALEIAIEASKQMNSDFIPLDEIDLDDEEPNQETV